jgi:transcriptional regulator with XRE-family HTH domain
MTDIHKKIAAIRRLRRLSQEELAERSHLSLRTYQRLESGHGSLHMIQMGTLAAALECSVEDILHFNLEENRFSDETERLRKLELEHAEAKVELHYLRKLLARLFSGFEENRGGGY